MTVLVIGTFRLPLMARRAGHEAMARVIAASRAEPGCVAYAYSEDVLDPGLFRVTEQWDSREALDRHFASPHMATWREERERLGMIDREVTAWTAQGAEAL
jgi:quinol monooxygenase YgiN